MLHDVIRFSLQFRSLVVVLAAALMVFGVLRLHDAPVDVLPEFKAPMVEIQTEALGLSAAEVEELVTVNLEEILASTAWLKTISSKSLPGLSSVLLVFEPGTDLMGRGSWCRSASTMAYALPNVSKPPVMLQPLSTASRSMIIGLSSEGRVADRHVGVGALDDRAETAGRAGRGERRGLGPAFAAAAGAGRSEALQAMGVTLDQVVETAGDALWVSPLSFLEASTPGTGGWIDTPNQRLAIQHVQPIISPSDLAEVALADKPLRLRDVAKVVEEHPPLIGDAIIDGGPGLLLVIEKFPNSDALEVVDGVEAALDELRQGLPGIEIDTSIFRSNTFIETSIDNLGMALLVGGAPPDRRARRLVPLVARRVDQHRRDPAVAGGRRARAFPARMHHQRRWLLAGLAAALAAVIDDAVIQRREHPAASAPASQPGRRQVDGGHHFRGLRRDPQPHRLRHADRRAGRDARVAAGRAARGRSSVPLAVSYVLALLASMAVALTVTPALALLLLRGAPLDHREPAPVRWLQHRYDATVARIVGAPRPAFLAAGLVVLAGLAVLPLLSWSLLPSFNERDVRISWETAPGTSLPETRRIMTQVSKELELIPGISNVAAHIGRAVTGDQVVDVESGQLWVSIDPDAELRRDARRHPRNGPGISRLRWRSAGLPHRQGGGRC